MPCTYCQHPYHTRKECEEIDNDFQTYLNVSIGVREDYVRELTKKGIVPGAVVRTYNRTKNFLNTSSEVAVAGLGNVDMFDCYIKSGRQMFTNKMPTKEHIILDDDDERMVTPNHCYEIIQESEQDWTATWVTTPVLTEDEFKAMFKGKKRHIGFEKTLYNCVVTRYTDGVESIEEMVARLQREAEEEKMSSQNNETGNPIYVITVTSTSDDYKRPHADTWAKTATSYEDAKAVAAQIYLEHVSDYETFYHEEDLFSEFQAAISDTDDIVTAVYDFFEENCDDLFQGEYVPCTFSVELSEEETTTCSPEKITEIVEELVETLTEG